MRIFSQFSDFYDGVQQQGFDDHVVYERKTVETEIKEPATKHSPRPNDADEEFWDAAHKSHPLVRYPSSPRGLWKTRRHSEYCPHQKKKVTDLTFGSLYFCGKMYPFFLAWEDRTPHYTFESDFPFDTFKTAKEHYWLDHGFDVTPYKEYLENNFGKEVKPDIHFYHKAPSILFIGKRRIVNPCLKEFQFQKVLDPYTAFQELDMFMGGVMGADKNPPSPMSDKEKVVSHGMDKWSFRKPPVPK